MVASRDTIDQILDVFREQMTDGEVEVIVRKLKAVTGNASFRQTVARLEERARLRLRQ